MTLDEAIEFSKYKATQQYDELQEYEYDSEEHEQIAEWLEDYKKFLEFQKNCTFDNKVYCYGFDEGYDKGRADAIEELKPSADTVAYDQGRLDIIDELLNVCGGKDEDCELCTFAIFRDDVYVCCKLMELKEQK